MQLSKIWLGNFIGTGLGAVFLLNIPQADKISQAAHAIVEIRTGNTFIENLILGIFCGILMYVAVTGYQKTHNMLSFIFPVATFILSGFNHCVADMFYTFVGFRELTDFLPLIATTIGNFIGCNFIKGC